MSQPISLTEGVVLGVIFLLWMAAYAVSWVYLRRPNFAGLDAANIWQWVGHAMGVFYFVAWMVALGTPS